MSKAMLVHNVTELSDALKSRREELGISQRQLMKKAGVGNATISRLESGVNQNIEVDTMFALLSALGLKLELVRA